MCNVSVITIFKRRHKKVKECLNSLINQTLSNTEIICIYKEENSDIDRFVKETQEKYKHIKIIYKTKAQDVTAKNKALEEAQGKYIIVMNGDMCLEKTALEKLYNAQEKNGTDIAICGFNIIDINTNQLIHEGLNNKFKEVEEVNGKNENFAYLNLDGGNKLIKKELLEKTRIKFPVGLRYEDVEFFYKLVPYINSISIVKKPFIHYVQRENSISNTQTAKTAEIIKVLDNVLEFYKEKNIYEKYKNELEYNYTRYLLCSSMLRMIMIEEKEERDKTINYAWEKLNTTFPKWKENPYLKEKGLKNKYMLSVNEKTLKIYEKLGRIKFIRKKIQRKFA